MYNREARRIINNLGSAIDSLSRAQTIIQVSEVKTSKDKLLAKAIFELSNNIRELKNEIREEYSGMND